MQILLVFYSVVVTAIKHDSWVLLAEVISKCLVKACREVYRTHLNS